MVLLVSYVLGALVISGLCSLLEASLLTVGVAELRGRADAGQPSAARLLRIKQERIDDAIAAILTLNTIAHTIGAALAGAQAAIVFGDDMVGVFSVVLTLLILTLTEIVPKTLGTAHASKLVGFVALTLAALLRLMAPALVLTRGLTRLLWHGEPRRISRSEVAASVREAAETGQLLGDESRVLGNVLQLGAVPITDVMTPRVVVVARPAAMRARDLLDDGQALVYSRVPLHADEREQIVGYVLVRDVLAALASDPATDAPLSSFQRSIEVLPETVSVHTALRHFLARREHIAIVAEEWGGVAGLVTLEDTLETMLGAEIVDEMDRTVDLRTIATDLRDRRLAEMQAQWPDEG